MDKLAEKMVELADKLGPQAVDAARAAASVAAYSAIQINIVLILAALVLLAIGLWAWKLNTKDDGAGAGIAFLVGGIMFMCGVAGLTDPWVYATIHNPDVWIAKKVLGL